MSIILLLPTGATPVLIPTDAFLLEMVKELALLESRESELSASRSEREEGEDLHVDDGHVEIEKLDEGICINIEPLPSLPLY